MPCVSLVRQERVCYTQGRREGGGAGAATCPGPQPQGAPNLRNSQAWPHQNWGEYKAIKAPFRGILNALEYFPPVFRLVV